MSLPTGVMDELELQVINDVTLSMVSLCTMHRDTHKTGLY